MNLSKKLPSQLGLVPKAISFFTERLKEEIVLSEEEIFQVRLILEESITNAIRHGNKFNPDLTVYVKITLKAHHVVIDVRDEGNGFDVKDLPNPTHSDKLLMTSGRGIFLIRKIVDEVTFYDSGRGIRMVKQLHRDKKPAPRKS